ncbi:TadG family pilus assembly protein [Paraburkholderia ferrariae]|uniref:TadG family pilus assembly protein n=1 Tax=Paraburkholderia ferrariae TaxID=386056 RepID=UPI00069370D9|nr:TadG family pilus assembly protein [Paraburkholderia ferrariae]
MKPREPRTGRTGAHAPHRLPRRSIAPARSRARGSVATIAAIALLVAVAALGVLDIANLYLVRRSMQNVADLAALAAVQQMDNQCQQPLATATANAASNGFTVSSTNTLAVTCGRWGSSGSAGGMTFVPNGETPLNGVIVTVSKLVPYFFLGPARTVQATSTAKATVIGSFSLATSLAQVNLLNGLLSSLLGTSVNLSLVSWNGIANANITLGQLAAVATSAGTVKGLLNTNVSVSGLAQLMINALQSGGSVVSTDVAASIAGLQAIVSASALSNVQIPVGQTGSAAGLLSVGLADAESAANVSLNALQALTVAAEIAQQGKSPVQVNLSLANLPVVSSLLPTSAELSVNVLSPPSIAIGEAGLNPNQPSQWLTYTHNAQVTVQLSLGLSVLGLASVNVPLYVEAAPATAWLKSAQCAATAAQSSSVVGVQTGIANLCLGAPPATAYQIANNQCNGSNPAPIAMLSVPVVGSVQIDANLWVPLMNGQSGQAHNELTFDGNGNLLGNTQYDSSGASVSTNVGDALGTALSTMSTQLNSGNGLSIDASLLGLNLNLNLGSAVGGLIFPVLSPLLSAIDTVLLGPLLQLLGVQPGVANITDFPLSCGVAQIVQ